MRSPAEALSSRRDSRAGGDAELSEHRADMVVNGLRRNHQGLGDLGVGAAHAQQFEDVLFSTGKSELIGAWRRASPGGIDGPIVASTGTSSTSTSV